MTHLIDAQLPQKLKTWMVSQGIEAIHTLDLPKQNASSDREIIEEYSSNTVIVVSKDKDFPHQRLIRRKPKNLLWITTGNIKNAILLELFKNNFDYIDECFKGGNTFVEMDNVSVIVHQ